MKHCKRVVGMEQVGDEITVHYRTDLRPVLSYVVLAVVAAVLLAVAAACDGDRNGLHQGPDDEFPQYRRVQQQDPAG